MCKLTLNASILCGRSSHHEVCLNSELRNCLCNSNTTPNNVIVNELEQEARHGMRLESLWQLEPKIDNCKEQIVNNIFVLQ